MNDIIIEQLIAQPTWISFLRPAEQWRLPECCNILHSKKSSSSMAPRYSWGIFRNIDVAIFLNCSQAAYISRSSVWHPRNGCNTWSPMVARMSWGRKAGYVLPPWGPGDVCLSSWSSLHGMSCKRPNIMGFSSVVEHVHVFFQVATGLLYVDLFLFFFGTQTNDVPSKKGPGYLTASAPILQKIS